MTPLEKMAKCTNRRCKRKKIIFLILSSNFFILRYLFFTDIQKLLILSFSQRLLDSLKSSPEDMKKKLSETSRKVSLLRVNEKTLIRRHRGKTNFVKSVSHFCKYTCSVNFEAVLDDDKQHDFFYLPNIEVVLHYGQCRRKIYFFNKMSDPGFSKVFKLFNLSVILQCCRTQAFCFFCLINFIFYFYVLVL